MSRYRTPPRPIIDAAKITAARRERGLSREEVAAALGISYGGLAAYEQGRHDPSASVLIRMAWLYRVAPDKLLRPKADIMAEAEAELRARRPAQVA